MQQLPGNFLPFLNIESTEEKKRFLDLCNMFIEEINHLSKTMCNNLLNCLQRDCDVLPSFTEKFKCYDNFLNHWKERHDKKAIQTGFVKRTISSTNGVIYKLYLKDPQLGIREQTSHTEFEEVRLECTSENFSSYPIKSEIGSKAVAAVEQTIKYIQEKCHGKLKRAKASCPWLGVSSS